MKRSTLDRLCLVAAAAICPFVGTACATARPAEPAGPIALAATSVAPAPQVVAEPAPIDPHTMIDFARVAGAFALPFVPGMVDHMVHAELDMRDFFHRLEDRVADAVADAAVPDLTILTPEPVPHTESSGFGWRDDPIHHTRRFHSGTDFRGKPGTPVVAAGDGVVTFCGRMGGYGNMVEIDHGGGVITRYAHLRRIETHKSSTITAGEEIGQVGSTGRATGPHLHFEVRLDGAPVSAIAAMSVATLQREAPIAGRFAALALAPELQAATESDVDPPKQHARSTQASHRPERTGRGKRRQVLW